jgi:hypothetical protein
MKVILDFDGVGDPKFKKVILSLIDKVVEYIPQFHKLIDEFIWLWPHLTKQSDWEKEKIRKFEEFAEKIREEHGAEVFILSSRKVPSNIAISVNSIDPSRKIEKLIEFSLREPTIYCTDSHNEMSEITKRMSNFIKDRKLVVIKV